MKLTPEQFLEVELQEGRCQENPEFVQLAKETAEQLRSFLSLKVIDYGAGTGVYANQFKEQGFQVVAQDIWHCHRRYMKEHFPDLTVVKKPQAADLMLFIEVAEHMADKEIYHAISQVDPQYIFFSSTHIPADDDEEWGHINLKEQDHWDVFWFDLGYQKIRNFSIPTSWSKLYQKI